MYKVIAKQLCQLRVRHYGILRNTLNLYFYDTNMIMDLFYWTKY